MHLSDAVDRAFAGRVMLVSLCAGLLESLEQPVSPFTGPLPRRSPGTPGGPGPSLPPR
jgi:hypothetical protein